MHSADNAIRAVGKHAAALEWQLRGYKSIFAEAVADDSLKDRLVAVLPALQQLLAGHKPDGIARLRRNVALHSKAAGCQVSLATAHQLRQAQKGPRLESCASTDLNPRAPAFVPGAWQAPAQLEETVKAEEKAAEGNMGVHAQGQWEMLPHLTAMRMPPIDVLKRARVDTARKQAQQHPEKAPVRKVEDGKAQNKTASNSKKCCRDGNAGGIKEEQRKGAAKPKDISPAGGHP